MNKIQEAFEDQVMNFVEWFNANAYKIKNRKFIEELGAYVVMFRDNMRSLLLTEKKCPECDNNGYYIPKDGIGLKGVYKCPNPHCKNGKIPLYYSPQRYEEITGKPFPDDGMVWIRHESAVNLAYMPLLYSQVKDSDDYNILIVQTGQGAPDPDYRTES